MRSSAFLSRSLVWRNPETSLKPTRSKWILCVGPILRHGLNQVLSELDKLKKGKRTKAMMSQLHWQTGANNHQSDSEWHQFRVKLSKLSSLIVRHDRWVSMTLMIWKNHKTNDHYLRLHLVGSFPWNRRKAIGPKTELAVKVQVMIRDNINRITATLLVLTMGTILNDINVWSQA